MQPSAVLNVSFFLSVLMKRASFFSVALVETFAAARPDRKILVFALKCLSLRSHAHSFFALCALRN
jgi:hypothetical protein